MQIHIISIEPAQKIKLNNQEFPSLPSCLCVYVCVRVHVSVHLRSFFWTSIYLIYQSLGFFSQ